MATPRARVNLERLLRSCDRLSGDLQGRAERKRFETYLAALQRHWRELKGHSQCSDETLSEFRRRIERLAELLDEGKLLSGAGSSLALTQAQCNSNLSRSQANAELVNRLREKERMQQALRSQLSLGGGGRSGGGSGGGGASSSTVVAATAAPRGGQQLGGRAAAAVGSSAEKEALRETLETQRAAQEDIISDLAKSVGELRDRTVQARQAVRDDCNTLDTTDEEVDRNRALLSTNNSRLKQQIQNARSSTCLVMLMLVFVAVAFFMTFFLMKVKSKGGR